MSEARAPSPGGNEPARSSDPMPAPAEAVALVDISKRFGSVVANDRVTFVAYSGEVHALIGENGAGKSTLMSILAGMYRPDSGVLRIGGKVADLRSPADAIERGVGMVYQHFMLIESFTVTENVMLGLAGEGFRLDTAHVEAELRRLSDAYGLGIDPGAYIWQLSVGEQQRVEIMRLLYRGARILVLDEPTAVLTPQEADSLIATLRQMASEGFCVIFISHKLDEVLAVADRITVLRHGAVIDTVDAASASRQELARMMVGRDLASALLDEDELTSHRTGDVVLAINALTAANDKRLPALQGVSLEVRAGETLGIAGVAGNGQRELAEVITGLRPARSGSVMLDWRDITSEHPRAIARAGVAHIPEDRIGTGLVGSLDLSSNAVLRAYRQRPISKGPFLSSRAIARFTDSLIGSYDVKTSGRSARLRDLSGGNQQKLLIARELAGEPKVIVAVHPTRGVDVGASEAIHDVLRAQRLRGAATLLISEDLGELLALCDRIAVLYEGRVMGIVAARDADAETLGLMMAGTSAGHIAAVRGAA
ncbi:MAG TPA: ABC transporter ATP-binding protein [Thermomicrobiales bacterium]|nr:ABC transporter ATP-binding protein [Thermomicrobiales bacterium]